MTCLNLGCGPFRAPAPWLNLDCWQDDQIRPDVVVDAARPLARWADGDVDRIYCGHVIEHVPWPDVPAFLAEIHRALRPGGELCVVAPDVYRAIRRWRDGIDPEGWELVESLLENPWEREHANGYGFLRQHPAWPASRHWWNAFEDRIVFALDEAGFVDVAPQPITPEALASWPVVAFTQWQCAVTARKA